MAKKALVHQIREIIERDNKRDQTALEIHETVRAHLAKRFEGKKVSRHFLNHIRKVEPKLEWLLRTDYGMFQLEVWGQEIGVVREDPISMLLAYDTNPIFSEDRFESFDCCHGYAAFERIKLREKMLEEDGWIAKFVDAFADYREAKDRMEKYLGSSLSNPSYHAIQNMLEENFGIKIKE